MFEAVTQETLSQTHVLMKHSYNISQRYGASFYSNRKKCIWRFEKVWQVFVLKGPCLPDLRQIKNLLPFHTFVSIKSHTSNALPCNTIIEIREMERFYIIFQIFVLFMVGYSKLFKLVLNIITLPKRIVPAVYKTTQWQTRKVGWFVMHNIQTSIMRKRPATLTFYVTNFPEHGLELEKQIELCRNVRPLFKITRKMNAESCAMQFQTCIWWREREAQCMNTKRPKINVVCCHC